MDMTALFVEPHIFKGLPPINKSNIINKLFAFGYLDEALRLALTCLAPQDSTNSAHKELIEKCEDIWLYQKDLHAAKDLIGNLITIFNGRFGAFDKDYF